MKTLSNVESSLSLLDKHWQCEDDLEPEVDDICKPQMVVVSEHAQRKTPGDPGGPAADTEVISHWPASP